ncbi:hypothetical protein M9Y10_032839 [Tritrichomonas musculus]|uniref:Uncharacterized protein n=1 Tax=Tritrichomonas musculus TaxID=1915356 RepID=A0ABR2GXY8_9EUKA
MIRQIDKNIQSKQAHLKDHTSSINSLNDFRGNTSKYVEYTDMRDKMIEYFSGTSDDLWFIQEIIDELSSILVYDSGSLFVIELSKKIAFPIKEWNDCMIQNAELILSSNDGPNIFLTLLSTMEKYQIYDLSNTIFNNFHRWADANFSTSKSPSKIHDFLKHQNLIRILFKKLIIFCRQDENYYKPLLLMDYFQNTRYLFILELLIQETNYSAAIKIILDNFDFCAKTSQFTNLIIFLYEHKDKSVRKFIFNQLIAKHKANFLKEPQWEIFRFIAIDGDLRHREVIAEILSNNLKLNNYPWFFEQYLVSIIFSLPIDSRIEFLKKNQTEILRFTYYPQFSMLLQYMELL